MRGGCTDNQAAGVDGEASEVEAAENDADSFSWKPRVIHTTDLGADPDDRESVRPDVTRCQRETNELERVDK